MIKLTAIALCAVTATFTAGCALDTEEGSDVSAQTDAADVQIDGELVGLQAVDQLEVPADRFVAQRVDHFPAQREPVSEGGLQFPPERAPGSTDVEARYPMGEGEWEIPVDRSLAEPTVDDAGAHCFVSLSAELSVADQLAELGRHAAGLDCTLEFPPQRTLADPGDQGAGIEAGPAVAEQLVASLCGNGTLDPGEQCDDANGADSDGCGAGCRVERGFLCLGAPSSCIDLRGRSPELPAEEL